ncbi:MAG: Qat anti-phage system QueC-like protein QatC [Luteolibacter sp.]
MIRYVCCPVGSIPEVCPPGVEYISLYKTGALARFEVGDVALSLLSDIRNSGIRGSVEAWDFCSIAMAVAAIDESVSRIDTADGWTRVLRCEIHLVEPLIWQNQVRQLEETLRFLTGDFWKISLVNGGEPLPVPRKTVKRHGSCVSLLSGGVDSLVGAIDLCRSGETPILVSKIVRGDSDFQSEIADALVIKENHIQWGFNSRPTSKKEGSTRARSIIFLAYAAFVASSLRTGTKGKARVPLYVPENGFISLNLPLTPLRRGSLSTKTTHPCYLKGLQEMWDAVGIPVTIESPFDYRFKTKGEMLADCIDQQTLINLIGKSTSCGRYGVYNQTHCGRCVPCLVRRSAFLRAGLKDSTETSIYKGNECSYVFQNILTASKEESAKDIRAAGIACLRVETKGIENFIGGELSFAPDSDRKRYSGVVGRGLAEIGIFLRQHGVL